jgi:hypothetical protein
MRKEDKRSAAEYYERALQLVGLSLSEDSCSKLKQHERWMKLIAR